MTDNQLIQLREFSQNQHWAVIREYKDHESGGKADRTEFCMMLQDAAARKFDVLLFWSLDRLTREGTLATLRYLELIESYGVHWRSLTEPWIDSAGPFRDVIVSLLASLAKQERVRISEHLSNRTMIRMWADLNDPSSLACAGTRSFVNPPDRTSIYAARGTGFAAARCHAAGGLDI